MKIALLLPLLFLQLCVASLHLHLLEMHHGITSLHDGVCYKFALRSQKHTSHVVFQRERRHVKCVAVI